jgi:nitrate/nitrite transport system substrate-binding protein
MVLHRHGSSIVLDQGAWDTSLRPVKDYFNFPEFAKDFRKYIRSGDQPFNYGIDSLNSHNYYLFRYWLSTLGIRTQQEVKLLEIEPSEMVKQLASKEINGYYSEAPWTQATVNQKQGFSVLVSKNIWRGHPASIVSTMIPWVENHPHTARALTAAILESCEYCDRPENREEIGKIVAQSDYLDTESTLITNILSGAYKYGGFDDQIRSEEIKDFYVFHHQNTDYFSNNDHANYPWLF